MANIAKKHKAFEELWVFLKGFYKYTLKVMPKKCEHGHGKIWDYLNSMFAPLWEGWPEATPDSQKMKQTRNLNSSSKSRNHKTI